MTDLNNAVNDNGSRVHMVERRRKPRISGRFPGTVRGMTRQEGRFTAQAEILNLSAGGLYVQVTHPMAVGVRLMVVFHIPIVGSLPRCGPWIAARGTVLRTEILAGNVYGVALRFTRTRFLWC